MAKANEVFGLDCEMSFLSGARLVLQTRLMEMCALRESALNWSDIEGVHDMRVASRRLRSAMNDFSPFIRKRDLRRLKKRTKQVADALGRVRDEDVAIAALEKLTAIAPEDVATGIEKLTAVRRRQRDAHRRTLAEVIMENRLAQLQAEWNTTLEKTSASSHRQETIDASEDAADKALTFRNVGRSVLTRRWQELETLSRSLYRPFKTRPLHDMRIAAKRLRYALELFSQCWDDGDALAPFAKEISEMQTSLGELHDCDVWIDWLGESLLPPHNQKDSTNERSMSTEFRQQNRHAIVWLMRHFVDERTKHFRAALARSDKWETGDFAARLAAQLNSEKHSSESHMHKPGDATAKNAEQQAVS